MFKIYSRKIFFPPIFFFKHCSFFSYLIDCITWQHTHYSLATKRHLKYRLHVYSEILGTDVFIIEVTAVAFKFIRLYVHGCYSKSFYLGYGLMVKATPVRRSIIEVLLFAG